MKKIRVLGTTFCFILLCINLVPRLKSLGTRLALYLLFVSLMSLMTFGLSDNAPSLVYVVARSSHFGGAFCERKYKT